MKDKRNNTVGPQINHYRSKPDRRINALLVGSALLLSMWSATQMFAYDFAYYVGLGNSFHHLYAPWKIMGWIGRYSQDYPLQIKRAESLGMVVIAALLLLIAFRSRIRANSSKSHEFMHGSARWADKTDIDNASLFGNKGVFVGAWSDRPHHLHYLRHNGPEHVLCFAPTRSGKGVSLVIPTLLSWEQSAVILDLKGELWELTSGWRQKNWHNKVLRFEPANPNASITFNPLEEIRLGTEYEVGDVQNLATVLVDPEGKGLNTHWEKTAQTLFVGTILHLLYKCQREGKVANLAALDAMLSTPERPVEELWVEMTTYKHKNGKPHPTVAATGRDMLDRPEEEAGSVLSTAKPSLSLYRDPVVAKNVSKSEFRIRDLMNHDDPVSLYIITRPGDKERLRGLVRVMINMILHRLSEKMEFEKGRAKPQYKHRLLMMMDEFASLGKLEIMQQSLAYVAGYGIKCYIIVQDISQLQDPVTGYGKGESITSNCHIQIAFPPNRIETAEHLSKLTGQTTIVKEQITTGGKRLSAMHGQVTRTFQEVQRPLLTADESMRMRGPLKDKNGMITEAGEMVVYCAGFPAIRGEQPLYFHDPHLQKYSEVPAPKVTDKLVGDNPPAYAA